MVSSVPLFKLVILLNDTSLCNAFTSRWLCVYVVLSCSVNKTVLNLELQVCWSTLHVVVFVVNENFLCQFILLVSEDVEALHGQSSFDVQVNQCPSGVKATSGHSLDDSHNTSIVVVDSCSEDSKL